jgi:hypothetical protein
MALKTNNKFNVKAVKNVIDVLNTFFIQSNARLTIIS